MAKDLVTIELSSTLSGEQLAQFSQQAQAQALDMAINAAHAEMVRLAQTTLHGTQQTYINGLQQPQIMGNEASIALVGVLPNAIENGQASYDMHNTLLGTTVPIVPRGSGQKGMHAKKGGGFYRAIPFRHGTPGTVGQVGPAMGNAYHGHAAVASATALGASIYAAAKKLKPSKLDPSRPGKTMWGGRLPPGMAPKLREHHHSDIYSGLVKIRKDYAKTSQNSYMTFRTISTSSPGWIRRATDGVHFFPKTAEFIRHILPAMIEGIISGKAGST